MNFTVKHISILFIFSIICITSKGQSDSVTRRFWGINSGYIHYASIDEIFTPYLYSGSSINNEVYKQIFSNKDIRQYSVSCAIVNRVPANVKLFNNFYVLGNDDGAQYNIITDEQFRHQNTFLLSSSFAYFRVFPFRISNKVGIYYGISADLFAGLRGSIANPELFSFSFNPALAYKMNINQNLTLLIESSLTLIGINLRRPYSGAEAQLIDTYTAKYYYDYAINNYTVNFVNKYFRETSSIVLQTRISKRIYFSLGYKFQYLKLDDPRKLTSGFDIVDTGLSIKFN